MIVLLRSSLLNAMRLGFRTNLIVFKILLLFLKLVINNDLTKFRFKINSKNYNVKLTPWTWGWLSVKPCMYISSVYFISPRLTCLSTLLNFPVHATYACRLLGWRLAWIKIPFYSKFWENSVTTIVCVKLCSHWTCTPN